MTRHDIERAAFARPASSARATRRGPRLAALLTLGLPLLAAGAAIAVLVVETRPPPEIAPDLAASPAPAPAPPVPESALALIFGTDTPDWTTLGDLIESTANNPAHQAPVNESEARRINAALPFAAEPIRAVAPFVLAAASPLDQARAEHCLALAIHHEAASEGVAGGLAVAQVVLNRVRHPAWPDTVCGVVMQGASRPTGCQFTFTCDGALGRRPSPGAWGRAQAIARAALSGAVSREVGPATHYHTVDVAPYWAPSLTKLVQVGAHIFYTWPGKAGRPSAFRSVRAAPEPWPAEVAVTAPGLGGADPPAVAVAATAPVAASQADAGARAGLEDGAASSDAPLEADRAPGGGPSERSASWRVTSPGEFETRAAPAAVPEPSLESLLPRLAPPPPLAPPPQVAPPVAPPPARPDRRGGAMDGL